MAPVRSVRSPLLRSLAASLLALGLGVAGASAKEPVYGFGAKPVASGGLSGKDNAAHFMADVEDYTEYWTHAFYFKSGHALFTRFLVTNLGPGDNKGAVQGHLITPDGDVVEFTDGRRDSSWSYSSDTLNYSLGKHALSGDGSSFSLKLANGQGVAVSVTFTNTVPGYKPGKVVYGSEKQSFLDFAVMSPRANAQGTFTVGGQTTTSEGTGYGDHFYTNYAQHKQAQTWITLAGFTGDIALNLTNIITTKEFGGRRLSFLAVGKGDKLVLTSNSLSFSQSNFWRDSKSKGKYRVPRLFRISHKNKKNGDYVKARIKVTKRLHRFDILKGLASFERFVVERLAKPMQYRFKVEMTIEGSAGGEKFSGKGEGLAEIVHINPGK